MKLKKIVMRYLLPILISLLTSCGLHQEPSYQKSSIPEIAARKTLLRGQEPESCYGGYGYILLTKRTREAQLNKRYEAAANAYLENFLDVSEYPKIPKRKLMPTFWMVKEEVSDDPIKMVLYFDHHNAQPMLARIGKMNSKGPILVAWKTPFNLSYRDNEALVFDLSKFSEHDMDRAIRLWRAQISQDPSHWENGFNIIKFRESLRSFILNYGDSIVSLIDTNR